MFNCAVSSDLWKIETQLLKLETIVFTCPLSISCVSFLCLSSSQKLIHVVFFLFRGIRAELIFALYGKMMQRGVKRACSGQEGSSLEQYILAV